MNPQSSLYTSHSISSTKMQTLQTSPPHHLLFSFPKTQNPTPKTLHHFHRRRLWHPLSTSITTLRPPKSFSSDEFPVDETFLQKFAPKDKETEDEARRKNWTDRDWAPWEEILTPEADFARKSLNEGEEVPLQTPEAIEAFKMLSPSYRAKKIKEMGLTEDEWYQKQFEMKGEIPDKLEIHWSAPLAVRLIPPRDWPPRGWEVDKKELEFIRGAHKTMHEVRVRMEELESGNGRIGDGEEMCLDRYKVFLKQYKEWVAANKDRLEEESYNHDQDYCPGRRIRGKDYKEGMVG